MIDVELRVMDLMRRKLGSDRLANSIVYLDHNPRRAGERITVADTFVDLPWDAHIAFVDLEPHANWGHACAYIAIPHSGDETIEVTASMPPFLKEGASSFKFLWRGPQAPEWAVAIDPD